MVRRILLAGIVGATLIAGSAPAVAQSVGEAAPRGGWQGREGSGRPDRGQGDGTGSPWQGRSGRDNGWRSQPPAVQPERRDPAWQGNRGGSAVNDWNQRRDWRDRDQGRPTWNRDRPGDGGRWDRRPDANRGGWNDGRRFDDRTRWSQQRRWDNGWRQDRRYDWNGYRSRYGDRYRIGRYYAPSGWNRGYSRFSIGVFLGGPLYADRYWLNDPYAYRLPPAYGTLRWVRYYDDALLVDVRDGYVVDAIHDFFW